ncbi:MAG: DsbA family protein [Kiloniellaceae bacterium]
MGAAIAAVFALVLGASAPDPAGAGVAEIFPDDRVLGAADAPITIIEYSSLTCPHCAAFHAGALPRIKKTWIAEGKARLVYRHFPLDGLALRAAAVANCVKGDRHFAFLDFLFENQERWARAKDPLKVLDRFARLAGIGQERFDACVNDEAEMNRILERAQDGRRTYNVQSTPTLIVNGRKVEGARTFESLDAMFRKIAPNT